METYKVHCFKCAHCGDYSDSKFCRRCEEQSCQKLEFTIENNWEHIQMGNVVKWHNDLYIVADIKEKIMDLIPFDHSNTSSHPSVNWPWNPERRIDSVKFINDNIEEYLRDSMNKLFDR